MVAVVNYPDQYSMILRTKQTHRLIQFGDVENLSHRSEDMRRARTINRDSMIFESASYREKKEESKENAGMHLKQKSNSSVVVKNADAPQTKVQIQNIV